MGDKCMTDVRQMSTIDILWFKSHIPIKSREKYTHSSILYLCFGMEIILYTTININKSKTISKQNGFMLIFMYYTCITYVLHLYYIYCLYINNYLLLLIFAV